jgi:hypothetical protein
MGIGRLFVNLPTVATSKLVRLAIGAGAAAVLLAGCGELRAPTALPGEIASSPASQALAARARVLSLLARKNAGVANAAHPSWMRLDAKPRERSLLYISDSGNDDVAVYSYSSPNRIGDLTGLADPGGLCSDAAGNVWVVNSASNELYEYANRATKRKATLTVSNASYLLGCSVAPTTGNLAVTDLGTQGGNGAVWIFAGAKGSPKHYAVSALQFIYFCGYDNLGNLFVDGLSKYYKFGFAELPVGGGSFGTISLSQGINFPGGVLWDGKYVTVADQAYQNRHNSAIYRLSVSGSVGTVKGTAILKGSCDILQYTNSPNGTRVVAPDVCSNTVGTYNYPAGGSSLKTLTGFQYPIAATNSSAPL